MSYQPEDASNAKVDPPVEGKVNPQEKEQVTASGEPVTETKTGYLLLLIYAALFGAGAALLTAAYIVVYNWGIKFFEQPERFGLNIGRFWPLVLLTVGGLLLGLAIKFIGQHGGLGVA